jgi:hypothetical protein
MRDVIAGIEFGYGLRDGGAQGSRIGIIGWRR